MYGIQLAYRHTGIQTVWHTAHIFFTFYFIQYSEVLIQYSLYTFYSIDVSVDNIMSSLPG